MKAIVGAAMLIAVATGVVACGGGDAAAPVFTGGAAGPSYSHGVPVTTLTCDTFPLVDIQAAAQQVVPSVTAQVEPTGDGSSSTPADTGSGLACAYRIATPRTDMSSPDRGLATIGFTLGDQVTEPEVPNDSVIDYTMEKADFAASKKDARQKSGQPVDDERPKYRDTPTQVGDGSYLIDEPHFQSDGTQTDYTMDLWVLHLPRPTSLDVTIGYYLTGLDEFPPPDKSLGTAIRDDNRRAQLAIAVARAVLAKIPSAPAK